MIVIVTESGKIYARGQPLYKIVSNNLRFTRKSDQNSSFEIKPKVYKTQQDELYKVRKVFLLDGHTIMWLNCEDPTNDNKMVTVVLSASSGMEDFSGA